ncbi:hypothetical protein [Dyella sp. A6]|uniref:hypothetical protein n=1 Tax=Dyella aluminiiresistens TaxID=3069105 RepID=UPI002E79B699|nr:hypothetical protein [Dyella sp. A6]
MMAEEDVRTDYWQQFGEVLKERTLEPLNHPTFIGFFLVAVLAIGGLGIWVEIFRAVADASSSPKGILLAINVFYPSVGVAAAAQLLINRDLPSYLKALALLMELVFVGGCITLQFTWQHPIFAIVMESLISVGALWSWWIANAKNPELLDKPEKVPSAAGPADPTASDLPGNLNGLKVQ